MSIVNLITDLPTELFLEITSYLGFEDTSQVRLALTCRRFYEILIPQILEDQAKHADKLIAASRIHLAQDLRTSGQGTDKVIDRSITEPLRGCFSRLGFRVGGIEKDLRCVQGLISRAKNLQEVDLQLGEACNLREIAAIINVCAERPGLSLNVWGTISSIARGPFAFDFRTNGNTNSSETPSPLPIAEKAKRYLWSFLGVFHPFFKDPQSQVLPSTNKDTSMLSSPAPPNITNFTTLRSPQFRISNPPRPRLISFSISSETLFQPSLYPVTLNVLNNSPIQTLSLSNLTLSLFDWEKILPSISMPALQSLTIGNLSLAFPDFLAFLERHDSIESIDLTGNDMIGVAKLPSEPILPLLNSLTANYEYLVPFLQHKNLGYFPVLQKLGILSPAGISSPSVARYPYPKHQLHPVYDLISQGRFTNLFITLDVTTGGLIDWLIHTSEDKDTKHQLLGVHSLVAACHGIHVAPDLIQEWMLRHSSIMGGNPADYPSRFSEDPARVIEILVWSASPQLESLKIGTRREINAPPPACPMNTEV